MNKTSVASVLLLFARNRAQVASLVADKGVSQAIYLVLNPNYAI